MKTLTIVIPVFNEQNRLYKTFEALKTLRLPRGLRLDEVIFVNDGSKDSTLASLNRFAWKNKDIPVKILSYNKNRGKGHAVKKGMLASNSKYTLLCDADMSTPLSELEKFQKGVTSGKDIIIGTRKNGKSTVIIHQPLIRELLGKGFTGLTGAVLGLKVSDFTCGFKLFSKDAVRAIFPQTTINRWGYDAEILYLAKIKKIEAVEQSVLWSDDKRTHVNIATAIPQTFFELAKIITIHRLIPSIGKVDPNPSSLGKAGQSLTTLL